MLTKIKSGSQLAVYSVSGQVVQKMFTSQCSVAGQMPSTSPPGCHGLGGTVQRLPGGSEGGSFTKVLFDGVLLEMAVCSRNHGADVRI